METNSNNLWAIGGIVVFLILGLMWWQGNPVLAPTDANITEDGSISTSTTNTPKTAVSGSVTTKLPSVTKEGIYLIYYTSKGFVPMSLDLPVGKSVRFVNNSGGKAMRIGSTDTTNSPVYNALNQSKTVGAGGTYEYTFVYKGVFTYSNINNLTDQGSITVR
ncbi:MAG: hypothetical protein A2648_01345 [Candidatus Lloydbacteria bacterium RIFCSPHIGHO2_01_FULL_41_20]|uniref:EfeO-type cupredoxin-like domain-containing protein n=1 Tax=Candidatus Lloydbacteria bacterium RIFCSPHIGHO2_01_FULL_41_20 TaxID=1798657 RepID=A0A1G2CS58_9BACT|nr:MAG: hypothetical protein A2648_01345 [Candidatus Lloydbacteria bacterium RIFCSPHIGHO2_01_FULL_41_20]